MPKYKLKYDTAYWRTGQIFSNEYIDTITLTLNKEQAIKYGLIEEVKEDKLSLKELSWKELVGIILNGQIEDENPTETADIVLKWMEKKIDNVGCFEVNRTDFKEIFSGELLIKKSELKKALGIVKED